MTLLAVVDKTQSSELARAAIGAILDGQSPNGTNPADLGKWATVYSEMVRAWQAGGTEAARRVFNGCTVQSPELIKLIAGVVERPKRQTAYSASELLAAQFPDIAWSVPGLIPVGLAFLAGRPKMGKSWLSLQIAVAVGSGGMVLGRKVDPGRVLYLALEDSPRRIQDRLRKQHADARTQIDFRFDWRPLTDDGIADLITALDQVHYRLIVIDTISRALGRADQMDLADMNVTMGVLQRITLDHNITMLLVDHHRKSAGVNADVIDDVMGATSKAAVADAALGIYRERGKTDATLRVTGRDVEDSETAIKFDPATGCWQVVGDASSVKTGTVQSSILTAITERGGQATVTQIAKWLDRKKSNVYAEVQELVAKGKLKRLEQKGKEVFYSIVSED